MGAYHFSLFPNDHFVDIRPYQYGWEKCAPLHSFGPFVRNHYLFHYIISGQGMLYSHATNGEIHEYNLEANQGFLICPGQINLYTADEKDPWKYVWIEFDGMRAEECLLQAGLTQDQPIYQPRNAEEGTKLQDQMLYFSENSTKSPIHLVGRLSLFLGDLIEFSSSQQKIEVQTQPDYYINEAVVYIQQNYHRDLTIDEVADFCKLNRNYFSRKFKKKMGCTPQEFLILQRMTNAAELMLLTDLPIKAIAAQCGYPNQLHFSQAFKKRYGLPPQEWRKQNHSKID
ncbi:MAG: AraC family transcriptional regulator [Lachnospiraceae bacterium]|nr:AraC family transcriptional regulator [Lachnospiraceae bacterium]